METETRRVRFVTLGCKVNQYETQGMRELFCRRGIVETAAREDPCDFVVINTCTVTEEADKENRYWIRRMRREYPGAKIVVTGCFAERNRPEIEALPEVDFIFPNHKKTAIADYLLGGCSESVSFAESSASTGRPSYMALKVSDFKGRSRAFIKIQDGCNHACSFCKVVMVRGRSRSRPLTDILDEVRRLSEKGYREMVLTGIQLGAYGLDLADKTSLSEVLQKCATIKGISRLRLSSIEPTDISEGLIRTLCEEPKCCPHLHIALQSGDDEVLRSMNRRYSRVFYRDLIARLRTAIPGFCLTLDVMAGFPGESEACFENTVALLRELKPLKCHVFPYSRREGTRAARLEDVKAEAVRRRTKILLRLSDELGYEYRKDFIGKIQDVLVERYSEKDGGVKGLTPNYLKVRFLGDSGLFGKTIPVRLVRLEKDTFFGEALLS